ncbi:hypothetical protein PLESTB_000837600 [Pleodorina starrii]|uniref:Ribosomal protein S2 n=1 Tax=Pleodorina starrii TaxID=330485 RepID=A0A9W6BLZ0_9CHLO|nr:hypothetical protein PLESTM_000153300 [Pleodorina starrii]GLC54230.1 hypothetical protein PLESTB_000837600 [Pleodorina starrii]GLC64468.1 hypothetical protein PLESTF_000169200 [Pleodorina starrii]
MLARLLSFGRPVVAAAEVASRAGISGLDASLVTSSSAAAAVALPLSRDGGRDASTSYEAFANAPQPWNQHLRLRSPSAPHRPYATLSSPAAAASQAAPASLAHDAAARPSAAVEPAVTGIDTNALVAEAEADNDDALRGLDMESLLRVLLHPVPLGRKFNPALFSGAAAPVVQLGREALFFDPASTLSSTMRALHVIRSVLRSDGHVLIVNPNPAMRPLLREASYLCLNRNVWFWSRDWVPGALSDTSRAMSAVLDPHYCQPNRRLMAARGLALRNPLCPPGSLEWNRLHPAPKLSEEDVRKLEAGRKALARQRRERERAREHRQALEGLAAARAREAKLLPAGVQPTVGRGGHADRLALVVALDLSFGGEAVREAAERKIPTVSLLNGHSDTAAVTYPVYASESHAGFQHFFLEWLLRVVNLPPPAAPGSGSGKV